MSKLVIILLMFITIFLTGCPENCEYYAKEIDEKEMECINCCYTFFPILCHVGCSDLTNANRWSFKITDDEWRKNKDYNLYLKSSNSIVGYEDKHSYVTLHIVCYEIDKKFVVTFHPGLILDFDEINSRRDNYEVDFKIDDKKVTSAKWDHGIVNNQSIPLVPKPTNLISQMIGHKNFEIELFPLNKFSQKVKFDIQGLDKQINKIAKPCEMSFND